jgi:hypothetical protein
MNDREQARYDMFKRAGDFGVNNASDFLPTPPDTSQTTAQKLFAQLGTQADEETAASVMGRIKKAAKGQQVGAGAFHGGTTSKAVQRDGLMAEMRGIVRSAGAIAEAQGKPELLDIFRMPHSNNDGLLVATARAFATAADGMKADFIALEHAADFTEALLQRVADFESADIDQNTGQQNLKGATASIGPLIEEGLGIVKQLDAIMHNKYRSNAEKLGAWATASHVERQPATKKPQPAPASTTPSK